MKALAIALVLVATVPTSAGCGASTIRVASLDDVERVRTTDDSKAASAQAPEIYARAEQERAAALDAHAKGDDVAANLHAERALAAYGHAQAVTRVANAIAALADSQKSLDDATAQEQSLAAERAKIELDAQGIERRTRMAREHLVPGASDDAGRRHAARSLAIEARLLCGAARLVSTEAPGLADAQGSVDKLDAPTSALSKAPEERASVDDAGMARAACLDVLTRARRAAGHGDGGADALLAELSASGGWDPTRDERGVVVTLRGVFGGAPSDGKLTTEGESKLETLGRVAAAHPGFGVQVVLHDATAPSAKDETDDHRAAAVTKALLAGGAPSTRLEAEKAGVRAPVVDPNDARVRPRNERIDVVFVSGG